MAIASDANVNAVWEQVRRWSTEERLSLASRILESLRSGTGSARNAAMSLADLRGRMASDQPPPTDAQVDQWLEEERQRKFG